MKQHLARATKTPVIRVEIRAQHKTVHHPKHRSEGRVQLWDELRRPHVYEQAREERDGRRNRSADGEQQESSGYTEQGGQKIKSRALLDAEAEEATCGPRRPPL